MAISGQVADFRPSIQGFRFTNSFPPAPAVHLDLGPVGEVGIGDVSQGVCGGMAFGVRDYFEAGRSVPPDTSPPPQGTPLFDFLTGRLLDSFDVATGVLRYAEWMAMPYGRWQLLGIRNDGTFARTVRQSWPAVRADIDAGHPSTLGLVTVHTTDVRQLGRCHQVLAYGYELDDAGALTLAVYDPNTPTEQADSVWIRLSVGDPGAGTPITHNVNINGSTLHGFFRSVYSPKPPPGA